MELHHTRRLQIELRDDEIETLKEVIRLAHTQLRNAPSIQMRRKAAANIDLLRMAA